MEWMRRQFEISRKSTGGSHVRPMEGMRGFAVFLVFIVHYCTLVEPWIPRHSTLLDLLRALHAVGNTGVDLFFVLSGYLIYGTLISRSQPFTAFMGRRIKRIYPAFLVVFLIYLGLSGIFPSESKIPADGAMTYLLQNLLLLPGLFPVQPMITVAWSLSYEMFYYLSMPAIVAAFDLGRRSAEWRILVVGLMAVMTAGYCASFGGPVRLIMFMAGILVFESINSRRVRSPGVAIAWLALAAGLFSTLLSVTGYVKIAFLFAAFYVFCLHCFLRPADSVATVFSWTLMRWLGNMSYSYYLLHGLALKASFMALAKVVPPAGKDAFLPFALMPLMFVLTLLPSAALFLLIERPFSLAPSVSFGRYLARKQSSVS